MSHIFDESFQTCASEPTGVFLRPCEIEIEFEELSLESKEEECFIPMLELELENTINQKDSEIDEEEELTPKRSYKQYYFGREEKEQYKICNSLSRFNERELDTICRGRKRINA